MSEAAANDEPALCERCHRRPAFSYYARMCESCLERATAKLSAMQLRLMQRAYDKDPAWPTASIALEPAEIAAAMGLVSRGLVTTRRDGQTSTILASRCRYKTGSTRWLRLTLAGARFMSSRNGRAT